MTSQLILVALFGIVTFIVGMYIMHIIQNINIRKEKAKKANSIDEIESKALEPLYSELGISEKAATIEYVDMRKNEDIIIINPIKPKHKKLPPLEPFNPQINEVELPISNVPICVQDDTGNPYIPVSPVTSSIVMKGKARDVMRATKKLSEENQGATVEEVIKKLNWKKMND